MHKTNTRPVARNKRAFFKFEVMEKYEAGLALMGSEVKSMRAGNVSFGDSHARFQGEELYLVSLDIPRYDEAAMNNHAPTRPRKLLLKKRELKKMQAKVNERGLTLVPLRIYFKGPWAKCEIGLCRGKRRHDKREVIKRRDSSRDIERALKRRR